MVLLITYILIALLFSFFCSISEAVLLSVSRPYILSLENKGSRAGRTLRELKDDVNRPLAAILTLNTIAHTVGAAGAGAQAAIVFGSAYLGLASGILTLLILVFSEIIPKTLGAVYWRGLAPILAFWLKLMVTLFYPFVMLSEKLTNSLSKSKTLTGYSREEFAAIADLGAQEEQLDKKESRILKNLFLFRTSKVTAIMTPRTVMFAVPEGMRVKAFYQEHRNTPFTRIPVYKDSLDDITGFVLKTDLILAQAHGKNNTLLAEYKREIPAVPDTNTIYDVFEFILDKREHIVLVIDEYGGIEGLVTLEDVIETLLGLEIVDEADSTVDMQVLARKMWEQRARQIGLLSEEAFTESDKSQRED